MTCSIKLQTRLAGAVLITTGCLLASLVLAFAPKSVKADGITLTIVGGTGSPGGTAQVTFRLDGDTGNQAVSADDFVSFDKTILNVAKTDCQLDSRIKDTHIFTVLPTCGPNCLDFSIAVDPSLGDPNQPLEDGVLLTCSFHIAGTAHPGTPLPLTGDQQNLLINGPGGVSDKLPATVVSGEITVTPCSSDTDCPTNEICLTQVCETVTCTSSADCPGGRECNTNTGNCMQLSAPTPTPTNTSTPTDTATAGPTNTPTNTQAPTHTPTNTLVPTHTPTNTQGPTNTPTNTQAPTNTLVPTNTPTNTQVPTHTPTNTLVPSNTPTKTAPPAPTPTNTQGGGGGGGGGGGCSTVQPTTANGSLLWFLIPAVLVAWRRRVGD
ncbi:MAG: hypothetical protein ACHQ9S_08365 [Candidatus Binatia bacterium]